MQAAAALSLMKTSVLSTVSSLVTIIAPLCIALANAVPIVSGLTKMFSTHHKHMQVKYHKIVIVHYSPTILIVYIEPSSDKTLLFPKTRGR